MLSKKDRAKKPDRPMGPPGAGITRPVAKAKNFKQSLRRLIQYLKPHKKTVYFMLFIAIISTVMTLSAPKILAKGINAIQEGIMMGSLDIPYIVKIIIINILLYFGAGLFLFFAYFIAAGLSQKVVYNLRRDLKLKLKKLPISYYDKNSTGDILSRLTNDVEIIVTTLEQSIIQVVTSVLMIVGIIILMLTINGFMTLITLLSLPLYIVVTIMIAKRSQKKFKEQQKLLGKINGKVEETISGQNIVKLFGREDETIEEFEKDNLELARVGTKAQFYSGVIMPMLQLVNNIVYVAISVLGGVLAGAPNPLMIGDIQAFFRYSEQFSQPIMRTANIANILQSTVAAAERIFEVLDAEEEPQDNVKATSENLSAKIEFNNVDFSYSLDKPLITNLNVKVNSGERVAIVGPTGAGKTTLVNLLLRFYEINNGSITIDGVDIRDLAKDDLRSMFGMVLQDTWLMSGTIKENIAYGVPDATDEMIEKSAKQAYINHYIHTLPQGYDTMLNEEISNISQGQKQLLTIARAILADNQILILDEATSSVDTRTEYYIQNAMTKMMKGKTCFIIAHRLSTIKSADVILVMKDGDIIEQGSHDDLLALNGFYADLYNSQFNDDIEIA